MLEHEQLAAYRRADVLPGAEAAESWHRPPDSNAGQVHALAAIRAERGETLA